MKPFFGVICWDSRTKWADDVQRICNTFPYWQLNNSGYYADERMYLVQGFSDAEVENKTTLVRKLQVRSGYVILADTSLYYKDELATDLDIPFQESKGVSDIDFLLMAYQKWGENCTKHLYGDFSFAIWDIERKRLFCARDHMGCRPFYYFSNDSFFVFSSNIEAIRNLEFIESKTISELWVAHFLTLSNSLREHTQYGNICRLEPAHTIHVKDGLTAINRYWKLNEDVEEFSENNEDISQELYRIFKKAVEERCISDENIGFELSGGLDSSSIAVIASEACHSGNSYFSYSYVLEELDDKSNNWYFPERERLSQIIGLLDFSKSSFIDFKNQSILQLLEVGLKKTNQPIFQGHSIFSSELYKLAVQDGCSILLSGFGGDEYVTNSSAFFKEESVIRKDWKAYIDLLPSKKTKRLTHLTKIFLYYLRSKISPVASQRVVKTNDQKKRLIRLYTKASLTKTLQEVYGIMDYCRDNLSDAVMTLREHQNNLINKPHIYYRLESTYLSGLSNRIEYRYPFLDVKLLEYFNKIPSKLKFNKGIPRYIFKEAMKQYLPEEVLWKEKSHVFVIPGLLEHVRRRSDEIKELIEESKKHNVFDYIDYKQLEKNLKSILDRTRSQYGDGLLGLLIVDLIVLVLQKWQREGLIEIGIQC